MAIAVHTVYYTDVPTSTPGENSWTIEGIDVPSNATAAILIFQGYIYRIGEDSLDGSSFDGSGHYFNHIASANDGDDCNVAAYYLRYGDAGFPQLGATGLTFTGSFKDNTAYNPGRVSLFFLSGTVVDSSFLVGYSAQSRPTGTWTSESLGTGQSDLAIVAGLDYGSTLDASPNGSGQTDLYTGNNGSSYFATGYEIGEDTPSISALDSFAGVVAFAVAAAGEEGILESISVAIESEVSFVASLVGTVNSSLEAKITGAPDLTLPAASQADMSIDVDVEFGFPVLAAFDVLPSVSVSITMPAVSMIDKDVLIALVGGIAESIAVELIQTVTMDAGTTMPVDGTAEMVAANDGGIQVPIATTIEPSVHDGPVFTMPLEVSVDLGVDIRYWSLRTVTEILAFMSAITRMVAMDSSIATVVSGQSPITMVIEEESLI